MLVTPAEKICCQSVNQIAGEHAASLVELSETAYAGALSMACKDILLQQRHIVFLTGPSGSGKTTTAMRLRELLRKNGKRAVGVSLDNFYLPRNETPFWDNGRPNFETIDALDLPYIERCANELKEKRRTELPVYEFRKGGRQSYTLPLSVDDDTYLIVEGIHALNPRLTELFPSGDATKIYVSAHTDFVDENGNFVLMAQDLRLMRRLIRDMTERGVSMSETLLLWEDVCRGERAYIRPYRSNADIHINSTHYYEPLLYKSILISVLEKNPPEPAYKPILEKLRTALGHFGTMEGWLLPQHSMLREFLPKL